MRCSEAAWCVAAGSAADFHEAGKRTGSTGCFVRELAGICWINSEDLAVGLALTARGIQNGPTLELIQTSFKDDNPSPPAELSQRISATLLSPVSVQVQ